LYNSEITEHTLLNLLLLVTDTNTLTLRYFQEKQLFLKIKSLHSFYFFEYKVSKLWKHDFIRRDDVTES